MTWWHEHPRAAAIARKHWKDAELVLLANTEPCITIRRDELANIDRVTTAVTARGLRDWKPKRKSSFFAVLVCGGDETGTLAATVKDLDLDPHRFHFYLHKSAPRSTLAGWATAGLPLDAVDEGITDWKGLHRLLGVDFNVQIVKDFAG